VHARTRGPRRLRATPAAALLALALLPSPALGAGRGTLARAGLSDLERVVPALSVDLRYAGARNITGARLPGYCREWAYLRRGAAIGLARVQRDLGRRGLALRVLDAYRPARASRALVAWAQREGRPDLIGTYVARRSRHNLGAAVDLTLIRRRDGRALSMGTRYDHLGPAANTLNARGGVLANRLTLKRAMERHGFQNYRREWWHFEHRSRAARYMDLTLGC